MTGWQKIIFKPRFKAYLKALKAATASFICIIRLGQMLNLSKAWRYKHITICHFKKRIDKFLLFIHLLTQIQPTHQFSLAHTSESSFRLNTLFIDMPLPFLKGLSKICRLSQLLPTHSFSSQSYTDLNTYSSWHTHEHVIYVKVCHKIGFTGQFMMASLHHRV